MMRLSSALSAICCLLSIVGASEFMIDTLGRHTQWDPAVAFDGENFLVVWADYRSGGEGIYCSRVNPDAGVLDPVGFPVSATGNLAYYPAVAFDGTNYLVVWEQWDANLTTSDIHAARVSPDGEVLDPVPIVVSDAPSYQNFSAVEFDGANYLVAWADYRSGMLDIYGARVTPAGRVLDSAGFVISAAPGTQTMPAVAFDGTNYLVVWSDYRNGPSPDIYGTRISPAGEVIDTAGIAIGVTPGGDKRPAVASGSSGFLAVWDIDGEEVYCARVTPDGQVLDPPGIPVAVGYDIPAYPAVAFDGTSYLTVWRQDIPGGYPAPCLFGAKVSPDGKVDSAITLVVRNYIAQRPQVACGGGVTFVVYKGWTYIVEGKYYGRDRIWGKFGPFPGVEEDKTLRFAQGNSRAGATVVRGVLNLGRQLASDGSWQDVVLLDAAGRRVMELQPGANDVRHLAPGVYLMRGEGRHDSVRIVLVK